MIKLIDCDRRLAKPQVIYISKDNIGTMRLRKTDGAIYTEISTKEDRPVIYVQETPEYILAIPTLRTPARYGIGARWLMLISTISRLLIT